MIVRQSLFSEADAKALAGHEAMHRMGLCTCPCHVALQTLLLSLPERDKAVALEATLATFVAIAEEADRQPVSEAESDPEDVSEAIPAPDPERPSPDVLDPYPGS